MAIGSDPAAALATIAQTLKAAQPSKSPVRLGARTARRVAVKPPNQYGFGPEQKFFGSTNNIFGNLIEGLKDQNKPKTPLVPAVPKVPGGADGVRQGDPGEGGAKGQIAGGSVVGSGPGALTNLDRVISATKIGLDPTTIGSFAASSLMGGPLAGIVGLGLKALGNTITKGMRDQALKDINKARSEGKISDANVANASSGTGAGGAKGHALAGGGFGSGGGGSGGGISGGGKGSAGYGGKSGPGAGGGKSGPGGGPSGGGKSGDKSSRGDRGE